MNRYTLTVEFDPAPDDVAALAEASGVEPGPEQRPLGIFIRDAHNRIKGGVYGWLNGGWLFVDTLWMHESLRGQDHGTRLMTGIEQAAAARGVSRAFLVTMDFQARPFYEKLGYSVFLTQEHFLNGHTIYGMEKRRIIPLSDTSGLLLPDDPPDFADVDILERRLLAYNEPYTGPVRYGSLAVFLRDGDSLAGGLSGWFYGASLSIDHAWIRDDARAEWKRVVNSMEQAMQPAPRLYLRGTGLHLWRLFEEAGYKIEVVHHDYPVGENTYYFVRELSS